MDSEKAQDSPLSESPPEQYSVFTKIEKRCITAMVAYAAAFSTLSSFIYFPAISQLADSLSVSIDKINLTITSYMAVATVAPALMGDAADILGRRPTYLVALTLYVAVNIATASAHSYVALLVLRLFQALAISGVFSVAYGVVTDIATPAERGSYVAAVSFASTIAPSLGPILGGTLTYAAGWPWIFWFLALASGSCLVIMVFCLPETSRNLVGNGSIRPMRYLQLPMRGFMSHWEKTDQAPRPLLRIPNPIKSLKILIRKDNIIITLACGLMYSVYTCICASLSVLFIEIYRLNQLQTGLIYIPFGFGGTVSSFFCGPLLNRAYRHIRIKQGLSTDQSVADNLDHFPVEKARLMVIWVPLSMTIMCLVAFGWTLHFHLHIAIPLCLQFILGLVMQLDFSIYNALLVDKNHRNPAAAQASSNIVRCGMAAIVVAFLQNLIDALGIGWTYTFMAGLCVIVTGLFLVDYLYGTAWRQKYLSKSQT